MKENIDFLKFLVQVWPKHYALSISDAQKALKKPGKGVTEHAWKFISPDIDPGDLLNPFTGISDVLNVTNTEVHFLDRSGETFYAGIGVFENNLKLMFMKVECPVCFGEEPEDCFICEGTGKV